MAKPEPKEPARRHRIGRRSHAARLLRTALPASVLMLPSLPAPAQPAPNARPTGGAVVAGAAAISQSPAATTIVQTSQRAAVNWQSFDVGSQQTVTFEQPSANALALNRVIGPNPSQIAGHIDANGQIVLVNQSGVVFFQGSQVNTNSLVASAAGISNRNFMAGRMAFDQPGNPNARVQNQGTITMRGAGLAALVAPQVANSGTITAKIGHVVLAGAKTATLDLYGDGLVSLAVANQVTQAPIAANGSPATALVTNTGVIAANGGTVQLTARAADGIVQTLVDGGGKLSAASVAGRTGTVELNGVGGSITVTGQLSATGAAAGARGGSVELLGTGKVTVARGAQINASGEAGGGVVAIGTTLARASGGPGVVSAMTAANTVIQAGAGISADATAKGDGGAVTVLSKRQTTMAGSISADGGPQGGNGGRIEESGSFLSATGPVSVAAPKGIVGVVLLDPSGK